MNHFLSALTLLAVVVVPATAAAAIPPPCMPAQLAPLPALNDAPVHIPGNLPAFVAAMGAEAPTAKLHGPSGTVAVKVAASNPEDSGRSFQEYLLQPSEKLPAGLWDLEIEDRC